MQTVRAISTLLGRYESGSLTRRELIQTLALLATAPLSSELLTVATTFNSEVLKVASINHVSLQVGDLERSATFYRRVFGLKDSRNDAKTIRLASGHCHVSLRRGNPVGIVDHFAFGVDHFDQSALTLELRRRGAEPREEEQPGFHVLDPDGVRVQISENDASN